MKAFVNDGAARVIETPNPTPAANEVLVRVLTAGICKTDVEIIKGYMGFQGVLDHEFVGIVEKSPHSDLVGALLELRRRIP